MGDRLSKVIVERQTMRAERPATGIMFERLWPARSAQATHRLVPPSSFTSVSIERGVERLLRGHSDIVRAERSRRYDD
jgi:hypothetical protein